MKNWLQRNYKTIIVSAFLIPIITVAIVSISHVTKWYGISNPFTWAMYLSIGIEIAALSALAAISANMGKKVYFPFIIVTLLQFIGNVYFAYSFIDIQADSFKQWVELVTPLLDLIGIDSTDMVGHKRFLALFAGGMLPVISLSFLHMLVKFTESNKENEIKKEDEPKEVIEVKQDEKVDAKDLISEISKVRPTEDDLIKIEEILNKTNNKNTDLTQTEQVFTIPVESQPENVDVEDKQQYFYPEPPQPTLTPSYTEEKKNSHQ